MPEPQREQSPDRESVPRDRGPISLVPRWLAVFVLIVLLAAGAVSAWLIVNADLARSVAHPTPNGGSADALP